MKPLVGNKVLCALLAALTVGMGAQTYYLVRVHQELRSKELERAEAPPVSEPAEPDDNTVGSAQGAAAPLRPVDPFAGLAQSEARIQSLFDSFYDRFDRDFADAWFESSPLLVDGDSFLLDPKRQIGPRVDLQDRGDRYEVSVDIPGTEESNITVTVENSTLVIAGTRMSSTEEEEPGSYVRRERHFGRFERRLPLPADADPDTLESEYEGGVLRVNIDKTS